MIPPAGQRCSDQARVRGDAGAGTAPPATRWLLVEQPGPWGARNALAGSDLGPHAARVVAAYGHDLDVRVLLIRRPGRRPAGTARRFAYVESDTSATDPGAGGGRVWWGRVEDPREFADLRLERPAGPPSRDPLYLVCTHGRRDVCCAVRGRPVAAAFAALRPEQTWECSHLGGDRFAANVAVLPSAACYGRVTPASAAAIVRATEAGRVVPELLRGRAGLVGPVQAAEVYARRELAEDRLDRLRPAGLRPLGGQRYAVRLAGPDPVEVTVVHERAGTGRLTCAATVSAPVPAWRLEAVRPAAGR